MPGRQTRFRPSGGGSGGSGTTGKLRWGPNYGNDEQEHFGPVGAISVTEYRAILDYLLSAQGRIEFISSLGALFDLTVDGAITFIGNVNALFTDQTTEAIIFASLVEQGLLSASTTTNVTSLAETGSLSTQEALVVFFTLQFLYTLIEQGVITISSLKEVGSLFVAAEIDVFSDFAYALFVNAAVRMTTLALAGSLQDQSSINMTAVQIGSLLDAVAGTMTGVFAPGYTDMVTAAIREVALQLSGALAAQEVVTGKYSIPFPALGDQGIISIASVSEAGSEFVQGITTGSYVLDFSALVDQCAMRLTSLVMAGNTAVNAAITEFITPSADFLLMVNAAITMPSLVETGTLADQSAIQMSSLQIGSLLDAVGVATSGVLGPGYTDQVTAAARMTALALVGTFADQGVINMSAVQVGGLLDAVNVVGSGSLAPGYTDQVAAAMRLVALTMAGALQDQTILTGQFAIGLPALQAQAAAQLASLALAGILQVQGVIKNPAFALDGLTQVGDAVSLGSLQQGGLLSATDAALLSAIAIDYVTQPPTLPPGGYGTQSYGDGPYAEGPAPGGLNIISAIGNPQNKILGLSAASGAVTQPALVADGLSAASGAMHVTYLVDYAKAGTFTFVIPNGVTALKSEVWAGGGAGGAAGTTGGGGGGAGGNYARANASVVAAADSLTIVVGNGGLTTNAAGGQSSVKRGATTFSLANGGNGGVTGTTSQGAGGTVGAAGTGDVLHTGGAGGGGGGVGTTAGGGGGGGAGDTNNGTAGASNGTAGTGGTVGGGNGGGAAGSTNSGAGAGAAVAGGIGTGARGEAKLTMVAA